MGLVYTTYKNGHYIPASHDYHPPKIQLSSVQIDDHMGLYYTIQYIGDYHEPLCEILLRSQYPDVEGDDRGLWTTDLSGGPTMDWVLEKQECTKCLATAGWLWVKIGPQFRCLMLTMITICGQLGAKECRWSS